MPKRVETLVKKKVIQIGCGCWHSAGRFCDIKLHFFSFPFLNQNFKKALTDDGYVYTWGSCKSGQLGQHHTRYEAEPTVALQGKGDGVIKIACGTAHTAVCIFLFS